ncbi:MAG: hypothetical protein IJZ35_03880 [Clostridia bacterium]|nr:hypothetical protein [Clostridia bacterium]
MSNKEKSFNSKLYAILTFVVIAVLLVVICVSTFTSRYTAFHPDELAKTYVDTIVQTGDGYNAYKNTLASYSSKYGDYIRKYYIYPAVYRDTDYKIGDNTDDFKGYNDEAYKSDATVNDNGTLSGQVTDAMYPYYEELVNTYGWDNYDAIYTNYINKLIDVRKDIFGDDYLTDEIFFTAFEANVSTYGNKLTGTEDVYDENTGVQLSYKSTGIYEQAYGDNYKLTVNIGATQKQTDIDKFKSSVDIEILNSYGVNIDDVSDAHLLTVNVLNDNEIVTSVDVFMVKIGSSWYVDNLTTDTDILYNFYK